jgi:hypothetical protein
MASVSLGTEEMSSFLRLSSYNSRHFLWDLDLGYSLAIQLWFGCQKGFDSLGGMAWCPILEEV